MLIMVSIVVSYLFVPVCAWPSLDAYAAPLHTDADADATHATADAVYLIYSYLPNAGAMIKTQTQSSPHHDSSHISCLTIASSLFATPGQELPALASFPAPSKTVRISIEGCGCHTRSSVDPSIDLLVHPLLP